MAICEKCKNYKKETQGCLYMDADCVNGSEFEPFTNYDRIKNMSVDEMAEFIPDWSYTKACKCDEKPYVDCNNECWKCVKEWLESEVE